MRNGRTAQADASARAGYPRVRASTSAASVAAARTTRKMYVYECEMENGKWLKMCEELYENKLYSSGEQENSAPKNQEAIPSGTQLRKFNQPHE